MPLRVGAARHLLDRVSRRSETHIVLCIDVEPDARAVDRSNAPPWVGFERFIERLPVLREGLSEATGKPAAFTWLLRMDPQVAETWGSPGWVAESYGDTLAELAESGDELGVHTHLWRWDPQAASWIADFQDPAWAENCLTMGLDAFELAFGQGCTSHRSGDRFLSGAMLSLLDQRGVKVDLTLEPGLPPIGVQAGEIARGSPPDYRRVPHQPYRSNPSIFPDPDPANRSGPLLVPCLSAPRRLPPFRREPLYLWDQPNVFRQRLAVELLRQPARVAAVVMRSDSVLQAELWATITGNLEQLTGHRQIAFMTASEAA